MLRVTHTTHPSPRPAGSLLLARTAEEAATLASRHLVLRSAGVHSELLDAAALRKAEPALAVPQGGAGLLATQDAQIVSTACLPACLLACICLLACFLARCCTYVCRRHCY